MLSNYTEEQDQQWGQRGIVGRRAKASTAPAVALSSLFFKDPKVCGLALGVSATLDFPRRDMEGSGKLDEEAGSGAWALQM